MDPVLAQIYGTNSEASDLEKLASAQMAEELAEGGEEMNVDGVSDDQIETMAQAVLNDIQEVESDVDDETMAKVAEADKLGRVMAHSMWQELGQIKEASHFPHAGMAEQTENVRRAMADSHNEGPTLSARARTVGDDVKKGAKKLFESARNSGAVKHIGRHSGKYGLGAGILATGAAASAARRHHKKKHGSALETLAEARALEILEANGIDPASLEPVQEKVAAEQVDPSQALQTAVEQGAWDILAQYGLEPQE